jgi:shikimate dehydrogenase
MHNAAFKYLGMNAVYLPFEVNPKDLKNAVLGISALGIGGVNVTIPHKEAVINYLDSLTYEAKTTGAVNTIVNKNNRLIGHNTDVFGFARSLKEDLKFNPRGRAAFIIGAGGAAKAVVFALAMGGARRIILTDKIDERALTLACEVELKTGCECIALRMNSRGIPDMILNSQLLVNATPCGMKAGDPVAINPDFLHRGLCVFDLVYNRDTGLLKAARAKGIKTTGGLNMLLYQGAKAFELWTGKKAPVETMRKTLC